MAMVHSAELACRSPPRLSRSSSSTPIRRRVIGSLCPRIIAPLSGLSTPRSDRLVASDCKNAEAAYLCAILRLNPGDERGGAALVDGERSASSFPWPGPSRQAISLPGQLPRGRLAACLHGRCLGVID